LIAADIARFKRVIGDGLRSRTDGCQATEVAIAVGVLKRMLDLGRPEHAHLRGLARSTAQTSLAKHTSRGAQANAELTFTADHPMGADHCREAEVHATQAPPSFRQVRQREWGDNEDGGDRFQ
jgi:hypothetical protein